MNNPNAIAANNKMKRRYRLLALYFLSKFLKPAADVIGVPLLKSLLTSLSNEKETKTPFNASTRLLKRKAYQRINSHSVGCTISMSVNSNA